MLSLSFVTEDAIVDFQEKAQANNPDYPPEDRAQPERAFHTVVHQMPQRYGAQPVRSKRSLHNGVDLPIRAA